jgi:hypothetical protein
MEDDQRLNHRQWRVGEDGDEVEITPAGTEVAIGSGPR